MVAEHGNKYSVMTEGKGNKICFTFFSFLVYQNFTRVYQKKKKSATYIEVIAVPNPGIHLSLLI